MSRAKTPAGAGKLPAFLADAISPALDGYLIKLAEMAGIKKSADLEEKKKLQEAHQYLHEAGEKISDIQIKLTLETALHRTTKGNLDSVNGKISDIQKELRLEKNKNETAKVNLELANKKINDIKNELKHERLKSASAEEVANLSINKIMDMEDAVVKLLSKVSIPESMIANLRIGEKNSFGRIEAWGYRDGALMSKENQNEILICKTWLHWEYNGFLISKIKEAGEIVRDENEYIAKIFKLD